MLAMAHAFDGAVTLTVRRTFPAARERVFRAWTEREAVRVWFRPGGCAVTVSEMDVREGGAFRFDLADGSDAVVGTYLEIVRPEKLVFTWSSPATANQETIVTIAFIARGPATQVILTHERFRSEAMRLLHHEGWRRLLDRLAAALISPLDR